MSSKREVWNLSQADEHLPDVIREYASHFGASAIKVEANGQKAEWGRWLDGRHSWERFRKWHGDPRDVDLDEIRRSGL